MNGHHQERRARPIVIVTGANAGVGFAICQRLLVQLAHRIPPDSLPQPRVARSIPPPRLESHTDLNLSEFAECQSLTLILACRSVSKAEGARRLLLQHLDKEVERIKAIRKGESDDAEKDARHAERFRKNVQIAVHRLDLASVESVFSFAEDVERTYPYVSHLVCNAGVASFISYDWPLAIKQLITDFIGAVSSPIYKIQRVGETSEDGLGWVWQCNVFGHYVLVRLLEHVLARSHNHTNSPSRILWMSSVEALPEAYDPSDWQLLRNSKSYEASKHQIDLLVGWFEYQQHLQREEKQGTEPKTRHFLCHPGVVRTNIAVKSLNSVFLDICMQLAFFTAHFLGSQVQTITPYKSAISAVHLMLVALPFITVAVSSDSTTLSTGSSSHSTTTPKSESKCPSPLKFGSQCDYWFREYVNATEMPEWDKAQAEDLVGHCEELFRQSRGREEKRLRS